MPSFARPDPRAAEPPAGRDAIPRPRVVAVDVLALLGRVDARAADRVRVGRERHLDAAAARPRRSRAGTRAGRTASCRPGCRRSGSCGRSRHRARAPGRTSSCPPSSTARAARPGRSSRSSGRAGSRSTCVDAAATRAGSLSEEVDEAEVGDVLLRLVELDAEGVGVRVGELGAGADVLQLAAERDSSRRRGRRAAARRPDWPRAPRTQAPERMSRSPSAPRRRYRRLARYAPLP